MALGTPRDLQNVVVGELVDRHDDGTLKLRGAVEMRGEIFQPAAQGGGVGLRELIQGGTAMHLERTHGGHDDDGRRCEAALPALDVHEFFPAKIESESGLGDCIVGMSERHARGQHGIAAMCDVGKRAAVQEGRHAFHALHQIGWQCLTQQRQQGTGDAEFLGIDRIAFGGETNDDALKTAA